MKEKFDFINKSLNEYITFPFWCRAFDESIIIGVTTVSSVTKFEGCCFDPRAYFRWTDERRWLFSSVVEEDFSRLSLVDSWTVNDERRSSFLARIGIGSCLLILLRRLDSWDAGTWTLLERRGLEKRLVLMRKEIVCSETLLVDYHDLYLFDGLMMVDVGFLDGWKKTSKLY